MQGVKTVSDNGWEDCWLDYTVSCQCNAANKIKKSEGNICATLSWIP